MNTDETKLAIQKRYPLVPYLQGQGIKLHGGGAIQTTNVCPRTAHGKDHLCVSVWVEEETWHCCDCEIGGSVIDWMAVARGIDDKAMFKELADEAKENGYHNGNGHFEKPASKFKNGAGQGAIVATYDYRDENGELLYQVVRYDPKDFRQRHMKDGQWVWNMNGIRRVLYNLEKVLTAEEVWIVEGEKDAETLNRLGCVATCNVGGACKWMEGYTESLEGKDVVLCGDNDDKGIKHINLVRESLEGKVRSTRTVKVPSPFKDVTEFVEGSSDEFTAAIELNRLSQEAPRLYKGVDIPVYSIQEIEPKYIEHCLSMQHTALNLSNWLPSLQNKVRSIVPGEIITFAADTGVGKTALLTNLALHAAPLTTLFFELELPETLVFERTMAAQLNQTCVEIEEGYTAGAGLPNYHLANEYFSGVSHIYVCPKPRVTLEELERIIVRSELKIGSKPRLVLLDYIQLVQATGTKSRYEKTSLVAEGLKAIARQTGVILVIASQIARKQNGDDPDVSLHEGKDSGSIENSSGLVIGAWRDQEDPRTLFLQILKNTKGSGGAKIECNFDGERMKITEKAKITESDLPYQNNHHIGTPTQPALIDHVPLQEPDDQ